MAARRASVGRAARADAAAWRAVCCLRPLLQPAPFSTSHPADLRRPLLAPPATRASAPRFFETFSFLPPLDDKAVAKQVDYIVNNGWVPCLEFSDATLAYSSNESTVRMGAVTPCYYDNRYWTMWKLPMFGCTDASQVLREIEAATKAFPDAYIRMAAFDAVRQVQVASMLVHRPASAKDYRTPDKRQV